MKKIKQIILFSLYLVLMASSINLQFEVMKNPTGIWRYNLYSLIIFFVIGGVILVIYRYGGSRTVKENENSAILPVRFTLIDKVTYQAKIADCGLTKREVEIGYLIVSDYSNAMIAKELYIAETTVKKHVSHIFEKTGTNSRKELKEFIRR